MRLKDGYSPSSIGEILSVWQCDASDCLVAAEGGSTLEQLLSAATRAADNVGPGSGPVYGTLVHSAFQDEVVALNNPSLFTEQSYLNGAPVGYGPSRGTGQISMPGNTAQMGYDYLGQMTSRKVTLTATPFRPNRSLFPMTVARGSPTPTLFWTRLNRLYRYG